MIFGEIILVSMQWGIALGIILSAAWFVGSSIELLCGNKPTGSWTEVMHGLVVLWLLFSTTAVFMELRKVI